jgi:hypothetical protein
MPNYQPNVPTGLVDLDVDYAALQGNFQAANTSFGVDHVAFDNTTAQNGYHEDIHFNPESTTATNAPNNYVAGTQYPQGIPATVAGIGQLFSSSVNDAINTDTGLYWLTGGGRQIALTRNLVPILAADGVTFLPGGLILQWGTGTSSTPFTWPRAFGTFYACQLTVLTASANRNVTQFSAGPTAAGATVNVRQVTGSGNIDPAATFFFMAIGI